MGGKGLAHLCATVHNLVQYWRSVEYRLEKPEFTHQWEDFSAKEKKEFARLIVILGKRDDAFDMVKHPEKSLLELNYRELREIAVKLDLSGIYKLTKSELIWRLINESDNRDPRTYQDYERALEEIKSKAETAKKALRIETGSTDLHLPVDVQPV